MMESHPTALPDVIEVQPKRFGDNRGYFSEVYNRDRFRALNLDHDWMQDNESRSSQVGTVRGIHYQLPPFAQTKLVRVLSGAIFDIAVDLRRGSSDFGKWVGCHLTSDAGNQLLVPKGFGHAFMTLTPDTVVLYKVDAPYAQEAERAIIWDDPDIAIDWSKTAAPVLSEKDAAAPRLRDVSENDLFKGMA